MLRKIAALLENAGTTTNKINKWMRATLAFTFILLVPLLSAQVIGAPSIAFPKLREAPHPQPERLVNAPQTVGNSDSSILNEKSLNGRSVDQSKPAIAPSRLGRKFVVLQIAMMGATIADAETSLYGLHHNLAREGNPIFGASPSRARIYGIVIPVTGFVTLLNYREKRRNPHSRWEIVPAILTAAHTVAVGHNLRVIGK